MNSSVKVAIVSYLNTLPFIYGFEESDKEGDFELVLANPRDCATLFMNGDTEIALIPVGVLPYLQDYKIVSDYCIGCDGEVRTVCLFYKKDLDEVTQILLDDHSRTSAVLIRILMNNYFQKNLSYHQSEIAQVFDLSEDQGMLAIGDKVFELEQKDLRKMDLGATWKAMTGLPFAFAVFVAKSSVDETICTKLNECLKFGVNHRQLIDYHGFEHIHDLPSYLNKNISYEFDDRKKEALTLFLAEMKNINF